ncbi:unnamed protein product [Ostreobium quekettii]|uniref:EF-hand domain-containing protein n=1 Tax=Ostreobium quekettii TaxID=121088 RepID=A0A8S1IXN3_9CHLO|nr:unnamed protein product [Ostreobium quekettii]|eukprot:evm.model.scf_779.7 EVM.evm.TU.scf_779.7   scf_779:51850-55900(+)
MGQEGAPTTSEAGHSDFFSEQNSLAEGLAYNILKQREGQSGTDGKSRAELFALKLERERSSMLSAEDIKQACDIVQEEATLADENGVEYIDYEGLTRVQDRCHDLWGSELDRCFRASTFLKLRGLGGSVPAGSLTEYIKRYVDMRKLHLDLSTYDREGCGIVALKGLEEYLGHCQLFERQGMDKKRIQQANQVAVQKFAFHHVLRNEQMRVVDLLTSTVMEELQEVRRAMESATDRRRVADSGSWFSRQVIETVLDSFFDLSGPTGGDRVTLQMLLEFEGTKFSELFVRRLFEEHVSSSRAGEEGVSSSGDKGRTEGTMGLMDFTRFVVAWRDRSSKAAVRYFFSIFDAQNHGYLDYVDVRTFFKEIHELWKGSGQDSQDEPGMCENVVNEIFAMVNPASPGRITKDDLFKCGKAVTVIGILSDMWEFYRHEHGEGEAGLEGEGFVEL